MHNLAFNTRTHAHAQHTDTAALALAQHAHAHTHIQAYAHTPALELANAYSHSRHQCFLMHKIDLGDGVPVLLYEETPLVAVLDSKCNVLCANATLNLDADPKCERFPWADPTGPLVIDSVCLNACVCACACVCLCVCAGARA